MRLGRNHGLALIAVLWAVSLLTVLATATLAIARSNTRMSMRSAQMITASTTLDSAIRLTAWRIQTGLDAGPQMTFSVTRVLPLFGQRVSVRVEREAGRMDLNAAEPVLLAALFIAAGNDARDARLWATHIADWRGADRDASADPTKLHEYSRAHLPAPRHGPFESVGELREVLGLTAVSDAALDALTVYSTRSPTIVRACAHPLVQQALTAVEGPSSEATLTHAPTHLGDQALRIHACTASGPLSVCRAAIIRLPSEPGRHWRVHAWYTQ